MVSFLPCLVVFWGFHPYMFFRFLKMTSLLTSNHSRSRPDVSATADCKVLRSPRPAAWDQETFPCIQAIAFLMLTGVQNSYRPCTPYISHSKQTTQHNMHRPCTPSCQQTTQHALHSQTMHILISQNKETHKNLQLTTQPLQQFFFPYTY